jgi:hypothetical protein
LPVSRMPSPAPPLCGREDRGHTTSCCDKSAPGEATWRVKVQRLQHHAAGRRAPKNPPGLPLRRDPHSCRRLHHLARDSHSHRHHRYRQLKVIGPDPAAAVAQAPPRKETKEQICGKKRNLQFTYICVARYVRINSVILSVQNVICRVLVFSPMLMCMSESLGMQFPSFYFSSRVHVAADCVQEKFQNF